MKLITIYLLISISNTRAGTFLRKGLYVKTDLAIGFGKTLNIAKEDAEKAIPKGYKIDLKNNTLAITCAFKNIPNN